MISDKQENSTLIHYATNWTNGIVSISQRKRSSGTSDLAHEINLSKKANKNNVLPLDVHVDAKEDKNRGF